MFKAYHTGTRCTRPDHGSNCVANPSPRPPYVQIHPGVFLHHEETREVTYERIEDKETGAIGELSDASGPSPTSLPLAR